VRYLLLFSVLLAACPTLSDDVDGDGFPDQADCGPTDAAVFPGADDPIDGVDTDCDGLDGINRDGDEFAANGDPPDCDDSNPGVFPGAADVFGDERDSDCDGSDGVDGDGDGFPAPADEVPESLADCDDATPSTNPLAPDEIDGVDDNCDGVDGVDADGDGVAANGDPNDCNDNDPAVFPGAVELPDDGLDNDCDGDEAVDADSDGFLAGIDDCDDDEPSVHLGAEEIADGLDNDCDLGIDEGTDAADDDGDGQCEGWDDGNGLTCTDGSVPGDCDDNDINLDSLDGDGDGWSLCGGDCDDQLATRYPTRPEVCDGLDQDCDGLPGADEIDGDGDGIPGCGGDCDDADSARFPGNAEVCDAVDSDCDGDLVDGAADSDGDGDPDCTDPDDDGDGSADALDCAPLDATRHPAATEVCDGIDSDCDGSLVDEFGDFDADGDPDCTDSDDDGDGSLDGPDCEPENAAVYPGAAELCDTLDADCDGSLVDEFVDTDLDGTPDCTDTDDDGDGSLDVDDCDPLVSFTHPGANERCDGVDNDCASGVPDNEFDGDGDGVFPCAGDCNDGDDTIFPGATETCDGADEDCDGLVGADELDQDLDGQRGCEGDCDDLTTLRFAGNLEVCDSVDNDCDATTDELVDGDGDGLATCETDCDDTDANNFPGNNEQCDGQENDCDADTDELVDDDGDGLSECDADCDDGLAFVYPGRPEVCDGDAVDEDCDGLVDAADPDTAGCTWLDIAITSSKTCALSASGWPVCWGGTVPSYATIPEFPLVNLDGGSTICGLTADGTGWCFANSSSAAPFAGPGLDQIMAGGSDICTRTGDDVTCDGDIVVDPGAYAHIDNGHQVVCALRTDGTLGCWEDQFCCQQIPTWDQPLPAGTFDDFFWDNSTGCALDVAGYATCWGAEGGWQASNNPNWEPITSPPNLTWDSMTFSPRHGCGITTAGAIQCWGWPVTSDYDRRSGGSRPRPGRTG